MQTSQVKSLFHACLWFARLSIFVAFWSQPEEGNRPGWSSALSPISLELFEIIVMPTDLPISIRFWSFISTQPNFIPKKHKLNKLSIVKLYHAGSNASIYSNNPYFPSKLLHIFSSDKGPINVGNIGCLIIWWLLLGETGAKRHQRDGYMAPQTLALCIMIPRWIYWGFSQRFQK